MVSESGVRALVLVVSLAAVGGCTRYEWVPDYETSYCRNRELPPTPAAFTRMTGEAAQGALGGIVESDRGERVPGAQIRLVGSDTLTRETGLDGSFQFDSLLGGAYAVRVARIGFARVQDTIVLPLPRGEQLRVVLTAIPLDGPCSGFAEVQVKKPWWKFW